MKLSENWEMARLWEMVNFCKGQGISKERIKRSQCTAYKDCPQEKAMATKLFNLAIRSDYIIKCPVIRGHYVANPEIYKVIKHEANI